MNIEEIKTALAKEEKALANPSLSAFAPKIQGKIDALKKQLSELENKAEEKSEDADKKIEAAKKEVEQAETKSEKKEAKEELAEAKEEKKDAVAEIKEVEKAKDKAEKIEEKVDRLHGGKRDGSGRPRIARMPRVTGKRGGTRIGAGRKKASSATKMIKPKKIKKSAPVFVKRKVVKKGKKAEVVKSKIKSVRAFGQKVEYKNDAEFCSKLIKAFKKRKEVSKKHGKRRTKPVFGIITSKVKDAVSKAIDNAPKKQIEANPKAFLAKAQRLEKSAIQFLNDFKAILGSDFKKSEISSEFGDLEKSIKKLVSKYKK